MSFIPLPIDMSKIAVVESASSCVKIYNQLFKFGFKIWNRSESMSNPQGGRLKD